MLVTLLLVSCACFVLYVYVDFKRKYNVWRKLNVPFLKPTFPFGNVGETTKKKHFGYIAQSLYQQLKHHGHYAGIFFFKTPTLLVLSPEFARTVLVKDFKYFVDRGVYFNKEADPLSGNLFFIEGSEWRHLRTKLTPTFTSSKMKMMFPAIVEIADQLANHLNTSIGDGRPVEIREFLARFTTDVIASCAFGVQCNSIENPDSHFRQMGKKMFNFTKLQSFKQFLAMLFRKQAKALNVRINAPDVTDFVIELVRKTIKYRIDNNVVRKDFMQLMIDIYKDGGDDTQPGLTIEEIAAQAFIFFFGGFETSSTTMTYALYEMAINQEIQETLRKEINQIAGENGDGITYENVMDLTYLDMVVHETLRKYPPSATLHRIANEDYTLPNGSTMPKGTLLLLSVLGFHRDEDYYPSPDTFDPQRFSVEQKKLGNPFESFFAFGDGPRICIGMRFGLMQTKIGLAMLVNNFKFSVCQQTEIPIVIDPINVLFVPADGVWLKIERIS